MRIWLLLSSVREHCRHRWCFASPRPQSACLPPLPPLHSCHAHCRSTATATFCRLQIIYYLFVLVLFQHIRIYSRFSIPSQVPYHNCKHILNVACRQRHVCNARYPNEGVHIVATSSSSFAPMSKWMVANQNATHHTMGSRWRWWRRATQTAMATAQKYARRSCTCNHAMISMAVTMCPFVTGIISEQQWFIGAGLLFEAIWKYSAEITRWSTQHTHRSWCHDDDDTTQEKNGSLCMLRARSRSNNEI